MNSSICLLETIKIEDGAIFNLSYHQKRFNASRKSILHATDTIDLSKYIIAPSKGLFRCRIVYNKKIEEIQYIPYKEKIINSLKIVPSNIEYSFKYEKRDCFELLLKKHSEVDEVIIEKEGYLTDTTISNIALYDGEKWFTPKKPLLKGTMREKLLDDGFLQLKVIKKESLHNYTHLALINAMIGFKIITQIKPYELARSYT